MRETLHASMRGQRRGFNLLSNLVIDAFGFDLYDGQSLHFQALCNDQVRRQLVKEAKRLQKMCGQLIKKLESKDPIAQVIAEDGSIVTVMNKTHRHKRDWR